MKQRRFKVVFKTGKEEIVTATYEDEAKILAQAEQIKKGNQYVVSHIEEIRY